MTSNHRNKGEIVIRVLHLKYEFFHPFNSVAFHSVECNSTHVRNKCHGNNNIGNSVLTELKVLYICIL